MSLVISKKQYPVNIFGADYQMTAPTVKMLELFESKKKEDDANYYTLISELFVSCGLPAEVVSELHNDALVQIMDLLSDKKK